MSGVSDLVLPIELPDGENSLLSVSTIDDWIYLNSVRKLALPIPEHPLLQDLWVRCIYVPTRRDKDLLKAISVARQRSGGTQRRWLGIDGHTDLGKTDLVINMAIEATNLEGGQVHYRDNHRIHLPVLFVESDPKMDGDKLLKAICRFAHLPTDGDLSELGRRLKQELPRMGTVLIVIDDAHMLRRTSRTATALPDALRILLRLPVNFVYVGAGLENSALLKGGVGSGYESAKQVRTRSTRWDITALRKTADDDIYDDMVRKFAGKVKSGIPGMKFSGLHRPTVRTKIFTQCDGQHAKIYCLLKDATMHAINHGDRDVTANILERYWDETPGEPHTINPDDWPDDMADFNAV